MRRELGGSGVTVTHISPRAAKTPFNTGDVDRFLALTGMKADPPDYVTGRIFAAIAGRHDSTTIGAMERIYGALNALAPAIIDSGLRGQVRRVRAAFS